MQKPAIIFLQIIFVGIFLTLSSTLFSQSRSYWEFNFNGGTSIFLGDIKQNTILPSGQPPSEWRFGGGVQFGRQFSYVFGLRGQFIYSKLAGTRIQWDKNFEADYYETNLNTTINFNNLFGRNKRSDKFFNIYLIGGIGLIQYNTTVYEISSGKVIHRVGHGYGSGIKGTTLEGIITLGFGADFRINDNFRITLESANKGMNSDFMDHYESGFKYDIYNYTSIGLSWRFGVNKSKKKSAPPYRYVPPTKKSKYKEEPLQEQKKLDILTIGGVIEEKNKPVMPPEETTFESIKDTIETFPTVDSVKIITPKEKIAENEKVTLATDTVTKPENKVVEFRVQISARYGRPISREMLSKQYNIPVNEIKENIYDGFYIYTVGSFATLQEAESAKQKLKRENGTDGTFIVAFEDNERVDLQSVLNRGNVPDPEYRVQISARYGKPIPLRRLYNKYNIPVDKIKENIYNDFYIYTVGSFATYNQAKNYKIKLIRNNGTNGAFVVAFSKGKRIDKLP
jgi:hypothetical protein